MENLNTTEICCTVQQSSQDFIETSTQLTCNDRQGHTCTRTCKAARMERGDPCQMAMQSHEASLTFIFGDNQSEHTIIS